MKLRFGFLKAGVSVGGSLLLVYLVSAFFCSSPPCFSKKNEFLLTVFMSEWAWFFAGLWVVLMGGVYILWSWVEGRRIEKIK